MPSTLPINTKILIVGGGTFGLSTALWLLRSGYKNVVVIDAFEIPSDISAANDVNKIIQSSYADAFHHNLALEALDLWQNDPVFKPNFHEVGIIYASTSPEGSEEIEEIDRQRAALGKPQLTPLTSKSEFLQVAPQLTGELSGWTGKFQQDECGWAHARNCLIQCADEVRNLGGEILVGKANGLIIEEGVVKGCTTEEGTMYLAAKTVIASGASSIGILDFEDQMLAKCWTFAHIKLTSEESQKFKNMPVILNMDQGFFFEPDTNNEIKICNETPGFTNYVDLKKNPQSSVPISRDSIPKECEDAIRKIFSQTLPEFADREFVKKKICWCTDTPDRSFLIGEHPDYKDGSLVLATGDSGHGFKFMPIVGKYVSELVINGCLSDKEKSQKWKWRPETAKDRIQDRLGGTGTVQDLNDISDWI